MDVKQATGGVDQQTGREEVRITRIDHDALVPLGGGPPIRTRRPATRRWTFPRESRGVPPAVQWVCSSSRWASGFSESVRRQAGSRSVSEAVKNPGPSADMSLGVEPIAGRVPSSGQQRPA